MPSRLLRCCTLPWVPSLSLVRFHRLLPFIFYVSLFTFFAFPTNAQNLTSAKPAPAATVPSATPIQRFNSRLILEEGRRYQAYKDTFQFVTIGVGHNLGALGEDSDEPLFERHTNADFDLAKAGRLILIDPQVDALLDGDLSTAFVYARKLVPSFDQLPPDAQEVVIDLAFNLGPAGLSKFRYFRAAVEQRNWSLAAWELTHKNSTPNSPPSDYSRQVPNRAARNAALLNRLAQNPGS